MSEAVFVEAPARLHFGVLDLRGDLGRRFGGIGAAAPAPSLLLEARPAGELKAEGPDAARALEFARRFARHHGLDLRLHFCLHRSIPAHAGLGSGTQLALAVARASAELSGLPTDVTALARAVERGRRSRRPAAGAAPVPRRVVRDRRRPAGQARTRGRRRGGGVRPAPVPQRAGCRAGFASGLDAASPRARRGRFGRVWDRAR
ncbi:MAG: hypothetical protein DMD60_02735 [Gemmatimonadetes bacterium]|nr:MAG: hypothetical protein DMD60_02735 [Gemmatimonadota bacterium]